jgi:hypothetical protein
MLRSYRFEHPKTEQSVTIRRSSYVWAGLFGAAYVSWIGHGSVLQAAAINLGFAVGVVVLVGASCYVMALQQFLMLMIGLPAIVLVQGTVMVNLVRTAFRRRGWLTRTAD